MIFDSTLCGLGEGPLWHPIRQELFWFDINNSTLHSKAQNWTFDTNVSAAGWVDEDILLIATARNLIRFDLRDGSQSELVPLEADNPITRSNDGRADPQGGFWIGTMGHNAEKEAGAIYRFYKGELRQLFDRITISNAICFAPDGTAAYFCDTVAKQIMRISLDVQGWPNATPVVALDFTKTGESPDGAVVDRGGNLWNAQWGLGRVAGYSLSGDMIDAFEFEAPQTTCPAFGGPDLKTLYCTSAAEGLDGEKDGATFTVETSYTGQAEHRVIL